MKSPKHKIIREEAQSLRIHPRAQRELVQIKVKQLMAELDLDAIGALHAVEYPIDGVTATWVIDGQTRLAALIGRGLGEWIVDVIVHIDVKDDARACGLFLKLNHRSQVSAFDKFENEVRAGIAEAVAVASLTKKHGLKINRYGTDGRITCVNALKRVYCEHGAAVLDSTLQTALATWGKSSSAVEGRLILGLALVLSHYDGTIDTAVLIKKLAKFNGGPSCLIGAGLGLRSVRKVAVPRCIAEVIVEAYNSGRQTHKLDPV